MQNFRLRSFDAELNARGWFNLNNRRDSINIKGVKIDVRGTDDAHLELDDYAKVAGMTSGDISIGVYPCTIRPSVRWNGKRSD